MKPCVTRRSRRYVPSTAALLASLALPAVSHAATVTLSDSDALGTSSFNTGLNWSDGLAPSAGNDYVTGDFRVRTPGDGNSHTFAGDSLTVNNTNGYSQGLMYKGTGDTGVITIPNLIFDGGQISHANGLGDFFVLDGAINVLSTSEFYAKQGSIEVLADISGVGDLTILASDVPGDTETRVVTLQGDNSGFTGNIDVAGVMILGGAGSLDFAIGADTVVDHMLLGTGTAILDGSFDFDLTGASTTNGDSWQIVDVATQTYGATFSVNGFSQVGSVWTDGGYTYDTTTGTLSVGGVSFIEWGVDADGTYGTGSNWIGGVAPAAGADVLFGNVITDNRTVTLNANIAPGSITFSNTGDGDYFLVPQAAQTITLTNATVSTTGRHWIRAGVNTSGGTLTLNGSGELVLDATNSLNSAVVVDSTNLAVVNNDALNGSGAVTVQNGGQLRFVGPNNTFFTDQGSAGYGTGTLARAVALDETSSLSVTDGADLTLNTPTGTGTVNADGGTLRVGTGNASSNVEFVALGESGVIVVDGADDLGNGGTVDNGTRALGNENAGRIELTNNVTIANELLTLGARELSAIEAVHLSSAGNNTWNGNILGTVGGTRYNLESTSGTLTLGGTISAPDTAVRNFYFSGDGNFVVNNLTDAGVDPNGDFSLPSTQNNISVFKQGAGTLTINTQTDLNDDYWFGTTTVEAGSLVVNSDGSENGELRSTVTVNAGATFDVSDFGTYNLIPIAPYSVGIGGGGTVVANTLGVFESSTVTPGDSVGTLDVTGNVLLRYFDTGAATVPDTGSFNFELGNSGTVVGGAENDLIDISGTLTTTIEAAATGSQFVFNITPAEGALDASNNYTLITAGTRTGNATAANFTANIVDAQGNPLVSRQTASVVLVGNTVQLDVNGNPLNLTWTGGANDNWDVNTSNNWSPGAQTFFQTDSVFFNATGGGGDVNVAENVAPAAMTVAAASYTFSGSDINAGSITVANNGTATFNNTVGGNVTVNNTGTLAGTGTFNDNVTVQSGGTLKVGGDVLPTIDVMTYLDATDGAGGNTTLSAGGTFTPTTNPDWQIRTVFGNGGEIYQGGSEDPASAPELRTTITGLTPGQDYEVFANFWAATGSGWRILAGDTSGSLTLYDAPFTDVAGATDGIDLAAVPYTNDPLITEGNRTMYGASLGTLTANGSGEIAVFIDDTGTDDGDDRTWYDGVSYSSGATAFTSASMTIEGDLTLNAGSTLSLDIASPTVLDSLIVGGTLNAGGTLDVNLAAGSTLEAGDMFDLLDFGSATGSFAFDLPTLAAGLTWDTSSILIDGILSVLGPAGIEGDYNNSGQVEQGDLDFVLQNWGDTDISDVTGWVNFVGLPGGNIGGQVEQTELDLVLTNWGDTTAPDFAGSSVPEPTTLAILGLGGVGFFSRRRNRATASA